MIRVQDIDKKFKGGREPVLSGISFEAETGSIYGLIGSNGAGKTTLMKIIAGIVRPDAGTLSLDGEAVYENPASKEKIFMMTEEIYFLPQADLRKMEKFYRGYCKSWSGEIYFALADFFGHAKDRPIGGFSKGMQRQAGLCAAFASGAELLLLDEAFDGLDLGVRRDMRSLLRYYVKKRGATAIISSHNLDEIEACADRFGMIADSRLTCDMDLSAVRESGQSLEEMFLGERDEEYDWSEIFRD